MNRLLKIGALATATALLLVGCSDDGPSYDYAIPKNICEVPVVAADLKPLLAPGESIRERISRDATHHDTSQSCRVAVDKKRGLNVWLIRSYGEFDIAKEAAHKYNDLRRVSLGRNVTSAGIAENGAAVRMSCRPRPGQTQYDSPESKTGKYTHLVMELTFRVGSGEAQSGVRKRAEIDTFLRSYLPKLTERWCA
ncbi:hypothetical protein AB0G74_29745 [Streptomyces sp. NPDC020875]|uniref:hypothetical protein n=1 Tax=Streptomyces sp. NPDC020875 TaxID=3154898 RepID=UPI0033DC2E05